MDIKRLSQGRPKTGQLMCCPVSIRGICYGVKRKRFARDILFSVVQGIASTARTAPNQSVSRVSFILMKYEKSSATLRAFGSPSWKLPVLPVNYQIPDCNTDENKTPDAKAVTRKSGGFSIPERSTK